MHFTIKENFLLASSLSAFQLLPRSHIKEFAPSLQTPEQDLVRNTIIKSYFSFSSRRQDCWTNHVFRARESDFRLAMRGKSQVFESKKLLKYWKCKFNTRKEKWRVSAFFSGRITRKLNDDSF